MIVGLLLFGFKANPSEPKEVPKEESKKASYQDTFYVGCMNAYYHHSKNLSMFGQEEAHKWCTDKFSEIKEKNNG